MPDKIRCDTCDKARPLSQVWGVEPNTSSGYEVLELGCTLLFVLLLRLDLDRHSNLCITRNTVYYWMVTPSQGSHVTMFGGPVDSVLQLVNIGPM
jgi:hypothetical protein